MENKPDCAQMEDELWAEYTRQENKKYFSMDPQRIRYDLRASFHRRYNLARENGLRIKE